MTEAQGTRWTPPEGPLGELTRGSEVRAAAALADAGRLERLERWARERPAPPAFATALRGPTVRVIAELKRRSPSKGVINEGLAAGARAAEYARGGAAALIKFKRRTLAVVSAAIACHRRLPCALIEICFPPKHLLPEPAKRAGAKVQENRLSEEGG